METEIMRISSISSRVDKLERASSPTRLKEAVVLITDGQSLIEISKFLAENGIRETADQPIIIIHGNAPEGQSHRNAETPLRFL